MSERYGHHYWHDDDPIGGVVIDNDALDPEFPAEARIRAEVDCMSCGRATRSSDHLCEACKRLDDDERHAW